MTEPLQRAIAILSPMLCGYYGPGYTWRNCLEDFLREHPRGRGIGRLSPEHRQHYEAARVLKRYLSRPKSKRGDMTTPWVRTANHCRGSEHPGQARIVSSVPRAAILQDVALQDVLDRNAGLEAENARLRAALRNFADPGNWWEEIGRLQWRGKRNAIEFAASVLEGE